MTDPESRSVSAPVSAIARTEDLFFNRSGLDPDQALKHLRAGLDGCDDGELFLEYRQSERLALDDGRIRSASFDTEQGFGLRAIAGDSVGYAHASDLTDTALARAAQTVQAIRAGHTGTAEIAQAPVGTNRALYDDHNPVAAVPFEIKVAVLEKIDAYVRAKDSRVRQVSASISGNWQAVHILRADGRAVADIRPLVRVDVSVIVGKGDRQESGHTGMGGRLTFDGFIEEARWQAACDEALRQALVNLEAVDCPGGEMPVVLGPGWCGVLLHEAIGHGLEGDFNRKKTSAFSDRIGQRVAAPGVTVVDDGTMENRRGSLTIDDEGTPTSRTTLIEDGILVGYMHDRMNARLMGHEPTGNGRRESYAHAPMPRMTNTVMAGGEADPSEILASVDNGLYAVNFGGGQVDITSGKFTFSATEAYLIENGKVTTPVKGATLIGNGPDVLTKVSMIGNDSSMDPGIGVCGKDGQGVPVGVGQPTMKIAGLTVGGTAV